MAVYSQEQPGKQESAKAAQRKIAADIKKERRANIYANRKYSFGISLNPYAGLSGGSNVNFFRSFNITFSDRLEWLDVGKNGSLETTIGIGFEPYQGTTLNLGSDYELLSKKFKANLYVGFQYSLGLAQALTLKDNSFVKLGFHNYLMPFVGVMWWPGKEDITSGEQKKIDKYRAPTFWQLFYIKLQVGYSFLLNKTQIDTSGIFDNHLYERIRNNTSNTLNFKIGIGINIPSQGKRRDYYQKQEYLIIKNK